MDARGGGEEDETTDDLMSIRAAASACNISILILLPFSTISAGIL
jgi:hypothetical protein